MLGFESKTLVGGGVRAFYTINKKTPKHQNTKTPKEWLRRAKQQHPKNLNEEGKTTKPDSSYGTNL